MNDKREERAARFAAEHRQVLERLRGLDYAAIESRVLAAAGAGKDPHAQAAVELFGGKLEDITPEQRKAGKALNFGIIYNVRHSKDGDFGGIATLIEQSYSITDHIASPRPELQDIPHRR